MYNFDLLQTIAKGKLVATSLLSASFMGLLATSSLAGTPTGTITNGDFSIDEAVGSTIVVDRVVTVNLDNLVTTITETVTGAPEKVDVLFLADNTGSMGEEIANVQANAQDILDDLRATYIDTTNVQFGVARYYGAPHEYAHYYYQCGYRWCLNKNTNSEPGDTYEGTITTAVTDTYTKTWKFKKSKLNKAKTKWYYKYRITTRTSSGDYVSHENKWVENPHLDGHTETYTGTEMVNLPGSVPIEMKSYELQKAIGATDVEIIAAIDNWQASGGKDWPEANFFALHQAATSGVATNVGWQTGYDTNWRDDAMKIIVWFGDAPSHENYSTSAQITSEIETITALNNNDIHVIAVNVGSLSNSSGHLDTNSQATNITTATSGEYGTSNASNVASTMETLIGEAVDGYTVTTDTTTTPIIDIDFRTSANTPIPDGITVTYVCTDEHPNGCNDVLNGETRSFQMIVEGHNAGSYNFETEVFDVETDNEVVDADNTINIHNID